MPNVKKINAPQNVKKSNGNRRGRPANREKVSIYVFKDKITGNVIEIATSLKNPQIFGPHGESATFIRIEYRDIPRID